MPPDTRKIITEQQITEGKRLRAQQLRQKPTLAEKTLWSFLRDRRQNGMQFRRQQNIDGFIVDFYCHAIALIVEVDGAIHSIQQSYDTERTQILQQRGLTILRITNEDIEQRLPQVLARIRAFIPKSQMLGQEKQTEDDKPTV